MPKIFRTVVAALAVLGLIVSSLTATTAPAAAASCQVSISGLPSKITIDSSYRRYWVKAWSKNCKLDTSFSYVVADVAGPNSLRNHVDSVWVDFGKSERITLYSSDYKAGKYTVIDSLTTITDDDYNDLRYTWVKKTFVAKYRSYTTLSAKRSGSRVKLSGSVKRYSPDWYSYVGYKRPVSIQRYSGGKWRTVKTVWSSGGKYSYSYKIKGKYSYRAKIAETSTATGSTSGTKVAPKAR